MSASTSRPAGAGTTALITGPTSGIGREFAEQLAARGHDLVLVSRDRERLERVATELANRHAVGVEVLVADLIDRDQLGSVEARLADPDHPIDILVNNAGFGLKGRFLDNTVEQEQGMFDVLVTAVMRLTHAALGPMVARGSGQILNVSSVAGYLPRGTYAAAKAYVTRFSEWAHHEYAPRGVTVTALAAGFVHTEFHQRMDVKPDAAPKVLWLEPDYLVREALADLDAGKAISLPSKRYQVLVAAARLVPTSWVHKVQHWGR